MDIPQHPEPEGDISVKDFFANIRLCHQRLQQETQRLLRTEYEETRSRLSELKTEMERLRTEYTQCSARARSLEEDMKQNPEKSKKDLYDKIVKGLMKHLEHEPDKILELVGPALGLDTSPAAPRNIQTNPLPRLPAEPGGTPAGPAALRIPTHNDTFVAREQHSGLTPTPQGHLSDHSREVDPILRREGATHSNPIDVESNVNPADGRTTEDLHSNDCDNSGGAKPQSRYRPRKRKRAAMARKSTRGGAHPINMEDDQAEIPGSAQKRARTTEPKTMQFDDIQNLSQRVFIVYIDKLADLCGYYIFFCEEHNRRFAKLRGAAQHLRSHGPEWSAKHEVAARELGFRVEGASPEAVRENNRLYQAEAGEEEAGEEEAPEMENPGLLRANQNGGHASQHSRDSAANRADAAADVSETNLIEDLSPQVGELYQAYWQKKTWHVVTVLPLGNFQKVGISGSLFDTELALEENLPKCYEKTGPKALKLRPEYQMRGDRELLCLVFDGLSIPEDPHQQFHLPANIMKVLGWVPVSDMRTVNHVHAGRRKPTPAGQPEGQRFMKRLGNLKAAWASGQIPAPQDEDISESAADFHTPGVREAPADPVQTETAPILATEADPPTGYGFINDGNGQEAHGNGSDEYTQITGTATAVDLPMAMPSAARTLSNRDDTLPGETEAIPSQPPVTTYSAQETQAFASTPSQSDTSDTSAMDIKAEPANQPNTAAHRWPWQHWETSTIDLVEDSFRGHQPATATHAAAPLADNSAGNVRRGPIHGPRVYTDDRLVPEAPMSPIFQDPASGQQERDMVGEAWQDYRLSHGLPFYNDP